MSASVYVPRDGGAGYASYNYPEILCPVRNWDGVRLEGGVKVADGAYLLYE
jgi:hypothetical protein